MSNYLRAFLTQPRPNRDADKTLDPVGELSALAATYGQDLHYYNLNGTTSLTVVEQTADYYVASDLGVLNQLIKSALLHAAAGGLEERFVIESPSIGSVKLVYDESFTNPADKLAAIEAEITLGGAVTDVILYRNIALMETMYDRTRYEVFPLTPNLDSVLVDDVADIPNRTLLTAKEALDNLAGDRIFTKVKWLDVNYDVAGTNAVLGFMILVNGPNYLNEDALKGVVRTYIEDNSGMESEWMTRAVALYEDTSWYAEPIVPGNLHEHAEVCDVLASRLGIDPNLVYSNNSYYHAPDTGEALLLYGSGSRRLNSLGLDANTKAVLSTLLGLALNVSKTGVLSTTDTAAGLYMTTVNGVGHVSFRLNTNTWNVRIVA